MPEADRLKNDAIKVGAIQIEPVEGNIEINVEKALNMVNIASLLGARYICLHEILPTDYVTNIRDLAEPIPGSTTNKFQEKATQKDIFLIIGMAEKEGSKLYNTAVLIGPTGILGKYRKIHLWEDKTMYKNGIINEIAIYEPGNSIEVFEFGEMRAGIMTCYDGSFPEVPRILALKGADVIFYPNNRPMLGEQHIQAMARGNSIAIVAANRIGKNTAHGGKNCFGESMIIDQSGVTLGKAWNQETVVIASINIAKIRKDRKNNSSFLGRRPSLYSALTSVTP